MSNKSIKRIKQLFSLQAESIQEEIKTRKKEIDTVTELVSDLSTKFDEKMYLALTEQDKMWD